MDYCIDPTDVPTSIPTSIPTIITSTPTLSVTLLPSSPPSSEPKKPLVHLSTECDEDNPCQECEGDCDDDDECAGNLICFQRNGFTAVPGCEGSGIKSTFRNLYFFLTNARIQFFFRGSYVS